MGKKKAGARAKGASSTKPVQERVTPKLRGFWDKSVAPSGEAPGPRGGHTATLLGSRLYVYGGADRSPATHGDLYCLELDGGKPLAWSRVAKPPADKGGEWPEARTDHAAAVAAGCMWMTGGQDPVGRAEAGCDSQYLPFEVWTLAEPAAQPAAAAAAEGGEEEGAVVATAAVAAPPTWQLRACEGAPPCPRASHGLVLAGDSVTLAVVGGASDEGPLDDLHLLDTATLVWSQLLLAPATAPAAREMHACFCLPGVVKVDAALAAEEELINGEVGSELVIMGGRSATGVLGAMEILNLGAAILLETAAEPLPDDAPDLGDMVEAGTATPLDDAAPEPEPEPEAWNQAQIPDPAEVAAVGAEGGEGTAHKTALGGAGADGKRLRPAPMPAALCGQGVAWWAPAADAPLPLAFGGTDMAGVDGDLWNLTATPNGKGKDKADWEWEIAEGVGGSAPTGRFAHTFTALPVPEGAGPGRPRPTALVFGGVSFEKDLNDLHLLWTA